MLSNEEIEIVGEAGSGGEAIERAVGGDLDVILLDMKLPDVDGLEVLRRLKELVPASSVLVISMHAIRSSCEGRSKLELRGTR